MIIFIQFPCVSISGLSSPQRIWDGSKYSTSVQKVLYILYNVPLKRVYINTVSWPLFFIGARGYIGVIMVGGNLVVSLPKNYPMLHYFGFAIIYIRNHQVLLLYVCTISLLLYNNLESVN